MKIVDNTADGGPWPPGTYEITKRIVVNDTGTFEFVDVPGGVSIGGFWPNTRSRITGVSNEPIRDRAAGILIEHQRLSDSTCLCGWGTRPEHIGASHARHVADILDTTGLLTPGASPPAHADTFTCPACGTTTRHPRDIADQYCPRCHWWTAHPLLAAHRPELFTAHGRTPPTSTGEPA